MQQVPPQGLLLRCLPAPRLEGGRAQEVMPAPKGVQGARSHRRGIMNVQSKPDLNGQLREVVGPVQSAEKRWEVNFIRAWADDRSFSLHEDKMHLVVPVDGGEGRPAALT